MNEKLVPMAVVAYCYYTPIALLSWLLSMQSEDFIGHQPYVVEDSYGSESAYEGNIAVNREGKK